MISSNAAIRVSLSVFAIAGILAIFASGAIAGLLTCVWLDFCVPVPARTPPTDALWLAGAVLTLCVPMEAMRRFEIVHDSLKVFSSALFCLSFLLIAMTLIERMAVG